VYYVLVVKTAEHMDDGVRLTDVREELISQSFAFARTFDQTGYIHYLDGRRDDATLGLTDLAEFDQTLIGNGDNAYVRFDCTEREVGALRFCVT
jgi:hypothetical protein